MLLQLVRNATLRLTYAKHVLLIDPCLAAKYSLESFGGRSRNPTTDLPFPPEQVIADVELVIVSCLQPDHFDALAADLLPKRLLVFCQPGDVEGIARYGFRRVWEIAESVEWNGIVITRTTGLPGSEAVAEHTGSIASLVFHVLGEPTVFWTGDTVWSPAIDRVIADTEPEVVVVHACPPLAMDAEQTVAVCRAAPNATVIATHMEAIDLATLSRAELRAYARAQGISDQQLRIPADGETIQLQAH